MSRFFLILALAGVFSLSTGHESPAVDTGERILSLESIQQVRRDGTVAIEHNFTVQVEGERIQRGPILKFLTVFRGPGGLVLKKKIEDVEVFRNGQPEPFKESIGEGTHEYYCGEQEVLLEPGVHEYTFRCVIDGEWKFLAGEAIGAFDVSGPFENLAVDSARLILRFPDGVELLRFSPAVYRSVATGTGYTAKRGGKELVVSTTGALQKGHYFLVHAIWSSPGFAKRSQWIEVIKQHPRIPIAGATAFALFLALILMLKQFRGNHRARLSAA